MAERVKHRVADTRARTACTLYRIHRTHPSAGRPPFLQGLDPPCAPDCPVSPHGLAGGLTGTASLGYRCRPKGHRCRPGRPKGGHPPLQAQGGAPLQASRGYARRGGGPGVRRGACCTRGRAGGYRCRLVGGRRGAGRGLPLQVVHSDMHRLRPRVQLEVAQTREHVPAHVPCRLPHPADYPLSPLPAIPITRYSDCARPPRQGQGRDTRSPERALRRFADALMQGRRD